MSSSEVSWRSSCASSAIVASCSLLVRFWSKNDIFKINFKWLYTFWHTQYHQTFNISSSIEYKFVYLHTWYSDGDSLIRDFICILSYTNIHPIPYFLQSNSCNLRQSEWPPLSGSENSSTVIQSVSIQLSSSFSWWKCQLCCQLLPGCQSWPRSSFNGRRNINHRNIWSTTFQAGRVTKLYATSQLQSHYCVEKDLSSSNKEWKSACF